MFAFRLKKSKKLGYKLSSSAVCVHECTNAVKNQCSSSAVCVHECTNAVKNQCSKSAVFSFPFAVTGVQMSVSSDVTVAVRNEVEWDRDEANGILRA